ncbi:MAG: type II toxin-antitoxin system PemK/MazF family toxin [Candidatus Gracilibacteria bacterium]|nr:type II toxin-antitoxin system PemK/MazF family toxin [Candidatus Gracilibacteria bacterium]MDQ7023138.1 type II toxin-antitoxin system PemK/MazF family toxin [Candidatus Gracilibacteria bacterium]
MYRNKLNKIGNLIDKIKTDINLSIISDFLEWFYETLNLNFNQKEPNLNLNKGEIFFIDLGKNIGSELNKIRPCIIYSGRKYNKSNTVIIIPLKSYKGKINNNFNIFIKSTKYNNLTVDSMVDLSGIKQVSKKRIRLKKGNLEYKYIDKIDKYILKIFEIKN